jgi:glycosyltransferase involved in cell wall biosynthesis
MPLVWQIKPEVELTVVGSSPPPEIEGLASARVDVRGWVADLQPMLQEARVMAVPVRYGAGVKGKITQGLAAGLPVVTTGIGAEGLGGRDGEHLLIGESAEALAERLVRVLEDDEVWDSLSSRGRELMATNCSLEILDERLRAVLGAGK